MIEGGNMAYKQTQPMRARRGRSLGLYGPPQDFLNHIRKPGADDMPLATEQKMMENEQIAMQGGDRRTRRRNTESHVGRY